jgi:hypothetical protein
LNWRSCSGAGCAGFRQGAERQQQIGAVQGGRGDEGQPHPVLAQQAAQYGADDKAGAEHGVA